MKTLGLIGGLSWESSAEYYRLINRAVQARLGGLHSAKLILWSFDFQDIATLQHEGDWDSLRLRISEAAQSLARAGAELLLVCSNTMHFAVDGILSANPAPLLHIADPLGRAICAANIRQIALFGTAFTMEMPFYRDWLQEKFGIIVIIPSSEDRKILHGIIYDELVKGVISSQSRQRLANIVERQRQAGAQGIVLGCTELMLLAADLDSPLPIFDTTSLHAAEAARIALT